MENDNDRYKIADKKSDIDDIWRSAQLYRSELYDIYRYFMPFRQSTIERARDGGGQSEGAERTSDLWDGTAPASVFSFVSNMKADWIPSFDNFFAYENGPLFLADADQTALRAELLQKITEIAHALLRPVRSTADELFTDLYAGTGAMYLNKGDKRQPLAGVAVPIVEVALQAGRMGFIERWVYKRKYRNRHIEETWPDGEYSDKLRQALKEDRNGMTEVTQFTYWDAKDGVYRLCVMTECDDESVLWSEAMATTPWATPRMFVVPGEDMGRGIAHLGLPFARTLHKTRELALRAAAFALLGLWTHRNDGVFNPETAAMIPGASWKVGSNGGPRGATLNRLDIPHNFDVSTIVINDEREQLRRVTLDDELPELADRVRSPTEIAGRMRRYDRNRGGATTRLVPELITPIAQRTLDLMEQLRHLPPGLTIDQLLTQVEVKSPAAIAQKAAKFERVVQFLQILIGLFGPDAVKLYSKIEEIIPDMARMLGIEERLLRKRSQTDILQELIQQAVAAAMEQQQAAQDGAPGEATPAPNSQLLQGAF